jgi:hypothetical protein
MPRCTTIASKLGVTTQEADTLALRLIRPDYQGRRYNRAGSHLARREARRQYLAELLSKHDRMLPLTYDGLEKLLRDIGLGAARGTIANDLLALGGCVALHRGLSRTTRTPPHRDFDRKAA